MAGRLSQDVKAEPNLTPILDMVFQLITFFMLVINFKSAEIGLEPEAAGGRVGPARRHRGAQWAYWC